MRRREPPATVFAVSRPRGKRGDAAILAFRTPRTTLLTQVAGDLPLAVVRTVRDLGGDDPTVLVEALTADGEVSVPEEAAATVAGAFPRARTFVFEAAPILKFLWFFRDVEDPLFLGHAGPRTVLDETYSGREPPRLHGVRGAELRSALEAHRRLVLTMGNALGVRPPVPKVSPAPGGWGAKRVAAVIDACAGYYAGLLLRWGSPLARVIEHGDRPPRVDLADAWLLKRPVTS